MQNKLYLCKSHAPCNFNIFVNISKDYVIIIQNGLRESKNENLVAKFRILDINNIL